MSMLATFQIMLSKELSKPEIMERELMFVNWFTTHSMLCFFSI